MKVKVKMMPGGERSLDVPKGMTYGQLLEKLKIDRETVIVFRDGKPVPEDEEVQQGEIKILKVVSGGNGSIKPQRAQRRGGGNHKSAQIFTRKKE